MSKKLPLVLAIAAFLAGDYSEAATVVYDGFNSYVRKIVTDEVGSDRADDLTHDVFFVEAPKTAKAFLPTWKEKLSVPLFRGWLGGITRNLCKRIRYREQIDRGKRPLVYARRLELLDRQQLRHRVTLTLLELEILHPDLARTLWLQHFERLTRKQVAAREHVSLQTVKRRIRRAHKCFAEIYLASFDN